MQESLAADAEVTHEIKSVLNFTHVCPARDQVKALNHVRLASAATVVELCDLLLLW